MVIGLFADSTTIDRQLIPHQPDRCKTSTTNRNEPRRFLQRASCVGNIYRWDGDALQIVATHNTPPAYAEHRRHSPFRADQNNAVARMIKSKEVVHVFDAAANETYAQRTDPAVVAAVELGGIRSALVVPMLKEEELIGAFIVSRQEVRPFTDKQIALVTNFAAQAIIAIPRLVQA